MMQRMLCDMPVSEKDAQKFAYDVIRSELGSIPYPDRPKLKEGVWIVPITARYPRVLSDEIREVPEKVRFMNFENVGEIRIDANKGELLYRPTYYEISNVVRENLEKVRTTVEMALVKVGANRFAQLPFPEHMHTPIVDILSWILVNDKLDMSQLSLINIGDRDKYIQNIDLLESVGLLRKSGDLIIPDNNLVEIEMKYKTLSEKISSSIAFFFEKGYTFIESIKQVLGPHLTITGFCYEKALEYGDLVPISYDTIDKKILGIYGQEVKRIKLPRYLIQLESIGLLEETTISGKVVWQGREEIFRQIQSEEEILQPIRNFIA